MTGICCLTSDGRICQVRIQSVRSSFRRYRWFSGARASSSGAGGMFWLHVGAAGPLLAVEVEAGGENSISGSEVSSTLTQRGSSWIPLRRRVLGDSLGLGAPSCRTACLLSLTAWRSRNNPSFFQNNKSVIHTLHPTCMKCKYRVSLNNPFRGFWTKMVYLKHVI